MCPSFSVYYMLQWCNISRIVIKSVTRPAAAGFVRCPPITCPLPPYGKLGLFLPLLLLLQIKQEWPRMHLGTGCRLLFKCFMSLIDQSLDLKTPQIAINRVLVKNMCELNHHLHIHYTFFCGFCPMHTRAIFQVYFLASKYCPFSLGGGVACLGLWKNSNEKVT